MSKIGGVENGGVEKTGVSRMERQPEIILTYRESLKLIR